MACRKNAYRGLTEMSEYMEKQNEEEGRRQRAFDEEQRKYGRRPPFWNGAASRGSLASGPHRMVRTGGNDMASVSSRGCGGCCSKDHPRITLDFIEEDGVATASISHALDPFVHYFGKLPGTVETTASSQKISSSSSRHHHRHPPPSSPRTYELRGLLSEHRAALVRKFGAHLVSVEHGALAASQRSHEGELERDDATRAAKKRRVMGEAAPAALLDGVLEICYANRTLGDNLDLADIAWMRTSCRAMGRIAARMARDRMGSVRLSYRIAPVWVEDGSSLGGMDSQARTPNLRANNSTSPHVLHPYEPRETIRWRARSRSNPLQIGIRLNPLMIGVRVYLERDHADVYENGVLFPGNADRLEVAKYDIITQHIENAGLGVYRARSNVQDQNNVEGSLECRVTACALEDNSTGGTNSDGEMIVQSIAFTFDDLVGIYVRMKLHEAKKRYNSSSVKKPGERNYIKALAKAAREAPGNASSFRGMQGW
eukprot:CAMPEP_0181082046 /NCGR_PEP_ID=MMETSP1071-20121207/3416_1 /TAXON_ID=35127 /ORGANISM="Thalassiosira sp., Strain NH16" /LENGTH=484 /DNA_ID=CAMNT_0023163613 /DNA_START=311 /DNA_END=1763 /DNA_ORIENTATION=-